MPGAELALIAGQVMLMAATVGIPCILAAWRIVRARQCACKVPSAAADCGASPHCNTA